jgi:hypothetical protein
MLRVGREQTQLAIKTVTHEGCLLLNLLADVVQSGGHSALELAAARCFVVSHSEDVDCMYGGVQQRSTAHRGTWRL